MKKHLLPLLVAAIVLPGNTPLEAKSTASANNVRPEGASLKKVMDGYARQYDNLRPVTGRCPH
ncbi:MAG: hypothetical protein HGA62_02910, partial [Chlorobiaceae bacterium]|nr:hypothetical protein [Chlorobiaceae bacterium]